VLDSVADILDGSVKGFYVAGLAGPDSPNPALEMNLFARLIHPPVVEDVPPQPVLCIFLAPARLLLRPPIDILAKHRDVGSLSSDEQAPSLAWIRSESDSGKAVGASLGRGPLRQRGELHAINRFAVFQRCGPTDKVSVVNERVQADVGRLYPKLDPLA